VFERETFTERFNRLTAGMTQTEIGAIMGVTEGAVRKIVNGDTQTMQLDRAIKLGRHLNISVYYLACEQEPAFMLAAAASGSLVPDADLAAVRAEIDRAQERAELERAALQSQVDEIATTVEKLAVHLGDAVVPTRRRKSP